MREGAGAGSGREELPPLRPSDADREAAAVAAREQLLADRLSLSDYEARLDGIFSATTLEELRERTRDLPPTPPSRPRRRRNLAVAVAALAVAIGAAAVASSDDDARGTAPATGVPAPTTEDVPARIAAEQAERDAYEDAEAKRLEWFTPCSTALDVIEAEQRPTRSAASDGRLSDDVNLPSPPAPYVRSSTGPLDEQTISPSPIHAALRTNGWRQGHATSYSHPTDGLGGFSAAVYEFADQQSALDADQDHFNASVCVFAADPIVEVGPPGALGARYHNDRDEISWVEGNRWFVVKLYGEAQGITDEILRAFADA